MLYYAPKNESFAAPEGALPPLLVKSHGGPTARARTTYNAGWQYFTSRGIAVADVDYGGSTGYGKEYRNRLKGEWGVVDVDDCCNAALHLAHLGLVDKNRLTISGGSAGGYTTLACLAFRPEVFSAGASYYGVADLNLLAAETHKFESRYLDSLVGPYPAARAVYDARSPVFSADRVRCPLVQFQGLEDRVVPPS
jgi:dipeptidyl aminopeptidase/acylaminoacyl peptidase